jgi:hypothetical protein
MGTEIEFRHPPAVLVYAGFYVFSSQLFHAKFAMSVSFET